MVADIMDDNCICYGGSINIKLLIANNMKKRH
jgi:hypothetical protein